MKNLKNKELMQLPVEELQNKLTELRKEVMKDNAQVAMRTIPKNPGLLRANKKMIARIIGLLNRKKPSKTKDFDGEKKEE